MNSVIPKNKQKKIVKLENIVFPFKIIDDQVAAVPLSIDRESDVVSYDEFLEACFYPRKRSDAQEALIVSAWLEYEKDNAIFEVRKKFKHRKGAMLPDVFGPDESHVAVMNTVGGKLMPKFYDEQFGIQDKIPVSTKNTKIFNFTDQTITVVDPDNTRLSYSPIGFRKPSLDNMVGKKTKLDIIVSTMGNIDMMKSAGYLFKAFEGGKLPDLQGKIAVLKHERVVAFEKHEAMALCEQKQKEINHCIKEEKYYQTGGGGVYYIENRPVYYCDFAYVYIIDPGQDTRVRHYFSTKTNQLFYLGYPDNAGTHPMYVNDQEYKIDLSLLSLVKINSVNPIDDKFEMVKYQYIVPDEYTQPALAYTRNEMKKIIRIPCVVDDSYKETMLRVTSVKKTPTECIVDTREFTESQLASFNGFYPNEELARSYSRQDVSDTIGKVIQNAVQAIEKRARDTSETKARIEKSLEEYKRKLEEQNRSNYEKESMKRNKVLQDLEQNYKSLHFKHETSVKEMQLKHSSKEAQYIREVTDLRLEKARLERDQKSAEKKHQEEVMQLKNKLKDQELKFKDEKAKQEMAFKKETKENKKGVFDKLVDHFTLVVGLFTSCVVLASKILQLTPKTS